MKILLDTHVWIWAVERPEELGSASRLLLENKDNEIFVSPISTLENLHLMTADEKILGYRKIQVTNARK
jgi:PIN domain nuclease of toxin-antitoxin system